MSDIALDTDGDLLIQDGDLRLVVGLAAIGQELLIRLRTLAGEWFVDTRLGIPYIETMEQKPEAVEELASLIKREIQQTPGVLQQPDAVTRFVPDFDGSTRVMTISFTVLTDEGVLEMDQIPLGTGVL